MSSCLYQHILFLRPVASILTVLVFGLVQLQSLKSKFKTYFD